MQSTPDTTNLARVKLGESLISKEQVAIKIMRKNEMTSVKAYESFYREVRLLSQCNHPNVVKVFEASVDGTLSRPDGSRELNHVCYCVLELAHYGELYRLISTTEKLSETLARTLFRQIIDCLEYLHSKNISHRDIKPENLLIDEEFNLKMADFGSAALTRDENQIDVTFDPRIPVGSEE